MPYFAIVVKVIRKGEKSGNGGAHYIVGWGGGRKGYKVKASYSRKMSDWLGLLLS